MVRLLAAVAAGFISCRFVSAYNSASFFSTERGVALAAFTGSVIRYAPYAYAVPTALLVLGSLLLRGRQDRFLIFECVVASAWLLALAWVLVAIEAWQVNHIILYSGHPR